MEQSSPMVSALRYCTLKLAMQGERPETITTGRDNKKELNCKVQDKRKQRQNDTMGEFKGSCMRHITFFRPLAIGCHKQLDRCDPHTTKFSNNFIFANSS